MITLQNGHIALTLDPAFGARILSLTDVASGRQWLVPGDCVGGDTYLGDQARGWDECFPTVAVCTHPVWGNLRDHGLLWGRNWQATAGTDRCTTTFADPRFLFARTLHLHGAGLTADYTVTNHTTAPLPYLWSQHALLAITPADRINLQGITALQVGGQPFTWPDHASRDLSVIGPLHDGFALKAYGDTPYAAAAEVIGADGGIRFDWTGADVPAFGLWLDYGGWPATAPVHQVALEPATAPADDLVQADQMGRARLLAPGESHAWSVHITMTHRLGMLHA